MTAYKKLTGEDPGRAAMKAARAAIPSRAPTPPKLQGLLPDVVGDDPNKLPKSLQGVENDVLIEEILVITPSPPPGRPVILQLLWQNVPIGDPITTVTPVTSTQTLKLPASATIAEGLFSLSYRLTYGGVITDFSPAEFIRVDKEAPNKDVAGGEIELPTEYSDGRITKERLDADPVIKLKIPLHSDRRTGDIARVYMGASEPGVFIGDYTAPDAGNSDMEVELTKAQVESSRDGKRIIYYKWMDRVGNEGPSSHELNVVIELMPAPSNLKPLEVPEAPAPGNLISIKDAFPNVGVVIKAYDNIDPLDQVAVVWDSIAQPRKYASDGFDMIFDVPYADVKRNGLGPRPVTVSYSVWRGTQEYPETTVVTVNVDLRRPGTPPDEPDDPDVGNDKLSPVTVQADKTTDPNKFELIDAGSNGTATTIVDKIREDGDVYQLYWGGVAVPGAGGQVILDGSESDDDPINFTIPHEFITAQGNGLAIPVHYEITNPNFPDNNSNSSLRQPVSVYVVKVTLPTPKIAFLQTIAGVEFLNCTSLRNISNVGWAAVVDVPGGAPLEENMELTFTWKGEGWDGTAPVPVDDYPFKKKLTGNEHVAGFTVYLPHDDALLPIKDGSGEIIYQVDVKGRTETSDPHAVQVIVRDGTGGNCPLP
jgi:hypothetical protein